ncbi:MAG: hypothetical protein ACKN9W_18505 [Methylococcus sp.]
MTWTDQNPSWTVPASTPAGQPGYYIVTIAATLDWVASGALPNPNSATCRVEGLRLSKNPADLQPIQRQVAVSWDYNTLANVPTSYPKSGEGTVTFTGYVDATTLPTITLRCAMTIDGVANKIPNFTQAAISGTAADLIDLLP